MTVTVLCGLKPGASRHTAREPIPKSLASETLAHLDTNRPWAIGYLAGRLSIGGADKQIAIFVEHIFDKQGDVQSHIVTVEIGPGIKNRIRILETVVCVVRT